MPFCVLPSPQRLWGHAGLHVERRQRVGGCGSRRDPGRKWAGLGGRGAARSRRDPHALPQPRQEPGRAMGTLQDTVSDPGERATRGVRGDRWPRAGGPFCPGAFGGAMCSGVSGDSVCGGLGVSPCPCPLAPLAVGAPGARLPIPSCGQTSGWVCWEGGSPFSPPSSTQLGATHPSCTSCTFWGDGGCISSTWVGKRLVLPAPAPSSTPRFGKGVI